MAKSDDKCYGGLSPEDQKSAADAVLANLGWMEQFTCTECGAHVGAEKSALGNFFVPSPRPHDKPKKRREPPRKRYPGGKRI
jgi:hypothetical protein